jgi:hypothetical protein
MLGYRAMLGYQAMLGYRAMLWYQAMLGYRAMLGYQAMLGYRAMLWYQVMNKHDINWTALHNNNKPFLSFYAKCAIVLIMAFVVIAIVETDYQYQKIEVTK